MEKFIQENDDRNSALCMLEIQEALTNLKQNINDKTSNNPQKRLF